MGCAAAPEAVASLPACIQRQKPVGCLLPLLAQPRCGVQSARYYWRVLLPLRTAQRACSTQRVQPQQLAPAAGRAAEPRVTGEP